MRRGSMFWGLAIILLGSMLLLDTLGFLKFNWGVAWGLILILGGAWFLWAAYLGHGRPDMAAEQATIPLQGASRAALHLHHAAGRLSLHGGAAPGVLLEGTFDGGLDYRTRRGGDTLDVDLRPSRNLVPFFWMPGILAPGSVLDWAVSVSGDIPLTLDVETGASDNQLDLVALKVGELRFKTGASATSLTLPAGAGATRATISCGAASVDVFVPPGVAARIRVTGALAEVDVDTSRFPRQAHGYASVDFDTAANRVDLTAELGVGSLRIR
jgi:hypothetical protein